MFFLRPADRVVADPFDDVQRDHFVFQQPERPSRVALGRRRARQGNELGLAGPVEYRLSSEIRRAFGCQHALYPFFDILLPYPRNRRQTGVEGFGDPAVAPGFAILGRTGFQQDTCPEQLAREMLAASDQRLQPLTLFRRQLHDILLNRYDSHRHRIEPPCGCGGIDLNKLSSVNDAGD
jgi:hypothetical protein